MHCFVLWSKGKHTFVSAVLRENGAWGQCFPVGGYVLCHIKFFSTAELRKIDVDSMYVLHVLPSYLGYVYILSVDGLPAMKEAHFISAVIFMGWGRT
jgi:hypothetical protein